MVDFAQCEGDAVRARTLKLQANHTGMLLQKLQPAALLQSPTDNEMTSAFIFSFTKIPLEVMNSVNLLQPEGLALQLKSSKKSFTLDHTDPVLAQRQNTVPTLRLFTNTINHLGFIIHPRRLELSSHTKDTICRRKLPTTFTDLRSFLGNAIFLDDLVPTLPESRLS